MAVEAIDSGNNDSIESLGVERHNISKWGGRIVRTETSRLSLWGAQAFFEKMYETQQQEIVCLKGKAGASASVDTEGNKEVEAHVEISNESGNASVEVKGTISQDEQGNTNAGVIISGGINF